MKKEKFMIVGSGGRESAFAQKLAEDTTLYAVIGHENPSITESVRYSGGEYLVGNPSDPKTVVAFAVKNAIDYVFVSADEPLACGVIDALLENNIKAVGGTKQATKIEWDKIYSIDLMKKVCPEYTPFYTVVSHENEIDEKLAEFKNKSLEVVVKPQGLTGGKGVKVMPEHLANYEEARQYAVMLLAEKPNEKVLLVEKLQGIEFTIMGITDGEHLVIAPASYDYPFRFENDTGAGTGGMGCFTNHEKKLPFMSDQHLDDCRHIMQSIIDEMKKQNLFFNGVLNAGFFITKEGIRFMEFNGRFGDPEGLNILTLLKTSFSDLIKHLWHKTLAEEKVEFIKKASVIKYLVAKEYPYASEEAIEFSVNTDAISEIGLSTFFSSAIQFEDHYMTLKKSRVVAVGALSDTIVEASEKVNEAIEKNISGSLEYRKDIGSKENLEKLAKVFRAV